MNPKAFYQNSELIPCSPLYSHKDNDKEDQYKSDLKLISAMCLQGMLGNLKYPWNEEPDIVAELAIRHAKELLNQLEAEK